MVGLRGEKLSEEGHLLFVTSSVHLHPPHIYTGRCRRAGAVQGYLRLEGRRQQLGHPLRGPVLLQI
jgi:hypothetical protein